MVTIDERPHALVIIAADNVRDGEPRWYSPSREQAALDIADKNVGSDLHTMTREECGIDDDSCPVAVVRRPLTDGAGAVIVDIASRRQAVPVVPDPDVGGSLRYDHERLEGPRLSPAAIRLLATCVGDLAESMGGTLTAAPQFEPVYLGDDRCSVALILTVRVADLNRHAAEDAALRVAASDQPWPVVVPSTDPVR